MSKKTLSLRKPKALYPPISGSASFVAQDRADGLAALQEARAGDRAACIASIAHGTGRIASGAMGDPSDPITTCVQNSLVCQRSDGHGAQRRFLRFIAGAGLLVPASTAARRSRPRH